MLIPHRLWLLAGVLVLLAACTSPTAEVDERTTPEQSDVAEREEAGEPGAAAGRDEEDAAGGEEDAAGGEEDAAADRGGDGGAERDESEPTGGDDEAAPENEDGHDHAHDGHDHSGQAEDGSGEPEEAGSDEAEPDEAEIPEELTEPFDEGQVVLAGGDEQVELDVYIADTPELRRRGLQGWPDLPERTGMLFVFQEDSTSGFWMKDTLIPLSIAFADVDGRIHTFRDMEPCESEPCPTYEPDAPYRYALEVEQGAFARFGVERGWVLQGVPEP